MNVTLISNHDNLIKAETAGQYIVEYYAVPERMDLVSIQIFDPEENTISEIEPDIPKIRFIEIINCIWNCADVYFAACDVTESSKLNISVFRYSTKEQSAVMICSFIKNRDLLNEDKRLKLFILSDSIILMQTEILHRSVSQNMMGNIEFSLTLYNLDSGTETAVSEANFINNGINTVIPVSEKKILVKTGYSYIEDSRLDTGSKNESFIESIYLTTVAKFIADITLEKEIVDMPMIESAYLDRHITKPFVDGDYTHFTIVDAERKITKCVFYQNETEEQTEYSIASFDPDDLYITHVVNNIPYVRRQNGDDITFINLKNAEADVWFYEERFLAQSGGLFLLESIQKRQRRHIYSYPGMMRVADEERDYCCLCQTEKNCYIYC